MCSTGVLVLLALFVRFTHSFHWDIVVGKDKGLEFYYNGTLTHTEDIPSVTMISSVTYDPVHHRVLFADYYYPNVYYISSFDLSTRKIQLLVTRISSGYNLRVVYDPVTQLLFWKQSTEIYSFSLNPAISNKAVDGNLLVTLDLDHWCSDIAVDSCGGYIYWITDYAVERARFDGSEREVLIDSHVNYRNSLAIDQQAQKIYWTETVDKTVFKLIYIKSADLNGKNIITLHNIRNVRFVYSLAVSKDFIYWKNYNQAGIWQLPKIPSKHVEEKLYVMLSSDCSGCQRIAASYTIKEQIQGLKSCEALQSLIPNDSKPESSVSICQNYCFQGDCIVSAEGQPICSCKAGYSGQRCQVNDCDKHCLNNGVCSLNEEDTPVCQCTADYDGERCDVSTCKDYCLQGNCSVGTKGQRKCSCKAGYSGERCDVPDFLTKCVQTVSMLRDMLNTDVTLVTQGQGVKATCATTEV